MKPSAHGKMMKNSQPNEEEVKIDEETKTIPRPGLGDDDEPLQPAFHISNSRESDITTMEILPFFTLSLIFIIVTVTIIISGILYLMPDLSESSYRDYTHEFYAEPRNFDDSQAICERREGQLVIFNSSKVNTFRPFVRNATLNPLEE